MHNKDASSDNEIERLPCTNNAESGMRKGITESGSPGTHCSQCSELVAENLRELRTETASCPHRFQESVFESRASWWQFD